MPFVAIHFMDHNLSFGMFEHRMNLPIIILFILDTPQHYVRISSGPCDH